MSAPTANSATCSRRRPPAKRAGAGERSRDGGGPATRRAASRSRPPGCASPRGARPWSPWRGQDGGATGRPARSRRRSGPFGGEAERRGRAVRARLARSGASPARRRSPRRAEQRRHSRAPPPRRARSRLPRAAPTQRSSASCGCAGPRDGEGVVDDERRHQQGPRRKQEHGLTGRPGWRLFGGALAQLVAGHVTAPPRASSRRAAAPPGRRRPGDSRCVVAARAEEAAGLVGRRGHAAAIVVQEAAPRPGSTCDDVNVSTRPRRRSDAVAIAQAELLGVARRRRSQPAARAAPAGRVCQRSRGSDATEMPSGRSRRSGAWDGRRGRGCARGRQARLGDGDDRDRAGGVEPVSSSRPSSRA